MRPPPLSMSMRLWRHSRAPRGWWLRCKGRRTSIGRSVLTVDAHQMGEPADELRRIGAEPGIRHPLRGRVGVIDPLPGADLVVDLLQDHHFLAIIERAIHPDLAYPSAPEPVQPVVHLDHQLRHVVDRRHDTHDYPPDVLFGGRGVEIDLLDHLATEYRRDVVEAGDVEPLEYRGRSDDVTDRAG